MSRSLTKSHRILAPTDFDYLKVKPLHRRKLLAALSGAPPAAITPVSVVVPAAAAINHVTVPLTTADFEQATLQRLLSLQQNATPAMQPLQAPVEPEPQISPQRHSPEDDAATVAARAAEQQSRAEAERLQKLRHEAETFAAREKRATKERAARAREQARLTALEEERLEEQRRIEAEQALEEIHAIEQQIKGKSAASLAVCVVDVCVC